MKNAIEDLPPQAENKEEGENTKKFSRLALSARKEANSILVRANGIKNVTERLDAEKQAYRIFAALDTLGFEIDEIKKNTVDNSIEKGRIAGFSSEKSAETFLKEVVEDTENIEETMAA